MGIFRKSFLYKIWSRFLTIFGDLMFSTRPPKVKGNNIRELCSLAITGDILCRKYTYYLDSFFIPGEYTHSGIVGYPDTFVVHAVSEGVKEIDIIDFVKDCDGFILLRPKYEIESRRFQAVEFAFNHLGKPYDFLFDSKESGSFYCHELTAKSLIFSGIPVIKEGHTYLANDLIRVCDIIYEVK